MAEPNECLANELRIAFVTSETLPPEVACGSSLVEVLDERVREHADREKRTRLFRQDTSGPLSFTSISVCTLISALILVVRRLRMRLPEAEYFGFGALGATIRSPACVFASLSLTTDSIQALNEG